MSINSLPPELVQVIFESLYYRTGKWTREPDYTTLAACSRTQRSWYLPAQRLLFRHIPKGVRPVRLFDDIRILDIILTPKSIPDLAFLLVNCSRLYELGLSAQGVSTLPPSVPSANIRALRLVECSVQSPILYDLLALFPTVRFLTVGTENVAPPPLPPTATPAPLPPWTSSAHTGPYIHSLRIFRFSHTAASILRSCVNLKEFVLSSLPVMGPSLDNLPRSIEHFNLNSHPLSTEWSPFIPLIVLLPLKTFTCDKCSRSQPDFDTLERLCRTHGVALFADASNLWPNEDPVSVSSFPRGRSTVHFPFMNQSFHLSYLPTILLNKLEAAFDTPRHPAALQETIHRDIHLGPMIKRRCVVDSSERAWSSSEPRLTEIAALSESGRGMGRFFHILPPEP